jgi:hypothetical protein
MSTPPLAIIAYLDGQLQAFFIFSDKYRRVKRGFSGESD